MLILTVTGVGAAVDDAAAAAATVAPPAAAAAVAVAAAAAAAAAVVVVAAAAAAVVGLSATFAPLPKLPCAGLLPHLGKTIRNLPLPLPRSLLQLLLLPLL